MLINSVSLVPDVCVATTTQQAIPLMVSLMVGIHWKVREGHFILWTTSRSYKQPLFFIHIACFYSGVYYGSSFIGANDYQINNKQNMIRQIIQNTKSPRLLYQNKLVCGCVYRSFSDLQAGIFFKFAINNGRLSRQQLFDMIQKSTLLQNQQRFMSIVENFRKLEIIRTSDYINYELSPEFIHRVQQFIKEQKVLEPVALSNRPAPYEPRPFEFIQILFEDKLPRKCKITGVSQYATCLTKEQFIYIKSDISYKIRILIDGIINDKQGDNIRNINALIKLNLLDSDEYYRREEDLNPLIEQLSKIKLVQLAGENNQYFRISKYLEHFTFKSAKEKQIVTKLNCSIIIETNFKVFATINSTQPRENKVIKKILSMLLKSEKEGVECEQLFIGEINIEFMKTQIFNKTGITTSQYFDFFKQYTDESHVLHKDLGKWKKLKFIGLEGPSEESSIPSNIKQEVKLWEHLKDFKDDYL